MMERSRPEYPGAGTGGPETPMDPDTAFVVRCMREADGPVRREAARALHLGALGRERRADVENHRDVHAEVRLELHSAPGSGAPAAVLGPRNSSAPP